MTKDLLEAQNEAPLKITVLQQTSIMYTLR